MRRLFQLKVDGDILLLQIALPVEDGFGSRLDFHDVERTSEASSILINKSDANTNAALTCFAEGGDAI